MPNSKVVIIGAGFAGVNLAKGLKNSGYDVLLLDRHNYHTFQPLLYQVATGGLEADSIAHPVRRIFRRANNVQFQMADVFSVDKTTKTIESSVGAIPYDILVVANGSGNNFFNLSEQQHLLLPLKTVPDALDFRSNLLQNLERAVVTFVEDEREELMSIAIVGGGPSGVELAGALAEMRSHVLPKDFPRIDFSCMHIYLFQSGDRILPAMSEKASAKSLRYLRDLGVDVHLNSRVQAYDGDHVTIKGGEQFLADTVLWTAGVKCSPPAGITPEDNLQRGGRIPVDEHFEVQGAPDVYAIGDIASVQSEATPNGYPQMATVAMQQGEYLADYLLAREKGESIKPFRFKNAGSMATIGRNKAVADLPFMFLSGFPAWVVWMLIHLFGLVGHRNRLVTFIDWVNNYIFYDRPLGLVIRPYKRRPPETKTN